MLPHRIIGRLGKVRPTGQARLDLNAPSPCRLGEGALERWSRCGGVATELGWRTTPLR